MKDFFLFRVNSVGSLSSQWLWKQNPLIGFLRILMPCKKQNVSSKNKYALNFSPPQFLQITKTDFQKLRVAYAGTQSTERYRKIVVSH